MKNNYLLVLFFVTFCCGKMFGQTTGSFDTTISFMGGARTLSVYVPLNYNSASPANLMVCLHGLGDNSPNYRTTLINSLGWATNFPNTIFVCPASSAPSADYFATAGSEEIIDSSISLIRSIYTIDTTSITLQGFSLGGRAALRYGLDHPQKFKGLLLNTPAIQGSKNAVNGLTYFPFNYSNASQVPIYITNGRLDDIYLAPIDSTYEQLVLNNAPVRKYTIAGLGHSIPPFSQMNNVMAFFDTPNSNAYDLELVRVAAPLRSCSSSIAPRCLVRNLSPLPIQNAIIKFGSNASSAGASHTAIMNLAPFEHAWVNLPTVNLSAGTQKLYAEVTHINSTIVDSFNNNNADSCTVLYNNTGISNTFSEGFEGSALPNNWIFERQGDDNTYFDLDNAVAKTGAQSIYAFNTILLFDNSGRRAEVQTPLLNLTTNLNPKVSFDMAYNFQKYTPPYFTADVEFTDTLEILISTDCGQSFTSLSKQWGAQLATFPAPILNPLSIASCFINPTAANWRNVEVDLSAYKTATDAVVKLSYISGLGGSINIDNFKFQNYPTSVEDNTITNQSMAISPNPANGFVNISYQDFKPNSLEVFDMTGRLLLQNKIAPNAGTQLLDVSNFTKGLYLVVLKNNSTTMQRKLQVQ